MMTQQVLGRGANVLNKDTWAADVPSVDLIMIDLVFLLGFKSGDR